MDARLAEVFNVDNLEKEVSALVAERSPETYAPTLRRALPRQDRGVAQPPVEDRTEVVAEAGPADAGEVAPDAINPSHYRKHPSGIECIEVTRHMNFNVGNAIKYLWRYMDKGDPIENLKKAQWYIDDEIRRLQGLR
jgi:hypothetical protein